MRPIIDGTQREQWRRSTAEEETDLGNKDPI
jgi:hypothetical protein